MIEVCVNSIVLKPYTVNLCLQAIKELLSPEVTQHLLANYYISSHCVPSSELMEHFEQWLLASLSLPPTQMEGNPHHVGVGSEGQFRVEPTANVVGGASKSPWQHVQDMVQNDNMMVAVPALQMFVTNTRSVGVVNKRLATPTLPVFCVQSHIQTVLLALHLVYEVRDIIVGHFLVTFAYWLHITTRWHTCVCVCVCLRACVRACVCVCVCVRYTCVCMSSACMYYTSH